MSFFDILKRKLFGPRQDLFDDTSPLSIGGTLKSLAAQDAESFARGEVPETRLIPHHAIKRDVIIAAYRKDFDAVLGQVDSMSWAESEKNSRIAQMRMDFEKHVYGVKRLGWPDLDKILALMKQTRTDLPDLEREVRLKNPMYKIVDPL